MTARPARSDAAFVPVTALFFAWGFICANNDPLIAAMRAIFGLSYTEALFTQIVSFIAFATMSLPAAALLARIGALRTILVGFATMIAGCLLIQLTTLVPQFGMVLAGLFVLVTGIVALQVATNPLAAALGPNEHSHYRLTLAHSFNSLGMVCGVHFGARVILGQEGLRTGASQAAGIAAVTHAFQIIAMLVLVLLLLVLLVRHRLTDARIPDAGGGRIGDALRSPWAMAGAGAIALYVGAEVSIGSLLILHLASPGTLGLPLADAGAYVANLYWGGALVGRFAGSWALRFVPATRLLLLAAASAGTLCAAALVLPGPAGAWCLLAVGLFNSVMFPTIFTLTLERSDAPPATVSGLLCLAIGAGAVVPLLAGQVADHIGLAWAFVVPMFGYAAILAFAAALFRRRIVTG
ncbi:MFS transporter [Sphingomonas sp. JC676]|uniref:MFS transporter n=1 Tax=Sphingomonas sp. JC676 TaxID=2768065 RepID=UPI001657877D|nr:MFS transporter [Sphingomonas sp. JC676]MBC9031858.1 MFS transporter [Sphingomonas sp. JC676]